MGTPRQTPGPERWEQLAWRIHDRLERERKRGAAAAERLATKALRAIEPPATAPAERNQTNDHDGTHRDG